MVLIWDLLYRFSKILHSAINLLCRLSNIKDYFVFQQFRKQVTVLFLQSLLDFFHSMIVLPIVIIVNQWSEKTFRFYSAVRYVGGIPLITQKSIQFIPVTWKVRWLTSLNADEAVPIQAFHKLIIFLLASLGHQDFYLTLQ